MSISLVTGINKLGYGTVGFNILKELFAKTKVSLFPIGNMIDSDLMIPEVKSAISNAQMYNPNDPCVRIWHQHDLAMFVGKNKHIGFPIFELDTFTDIEHHHLNSCDGLFVCSQWAKSVCEKNNIEIPISVIPLGVDRNVFHERDGYTGSDKKTIFLNCGKWETRKGHDILIKAWNRAFKPSDDVMLLMCNSNPFLTNEQTEKWRSIYRNPQIRFINRLQSSEDVARMMQMTDCGVFPSRAEGWNLEALEMLSCGKQLIITNYSAHTEFCSSDNSLLVDIDSLEPAEDGIWFNKQGNWATIGESQINQLAEHMRHVHDLKQSGNLKVNNAGIETAKKFSWSNTANLIIGDMNVIS